MNKEPKDIKEIFYKFDGIFARKDSCMGEARNYTNKIVAISIGVPATLFVVFRIITEFTK